MKKQKTFADRAKDIKKRFPRADWDKIERKDMMAELAKLRDEQEEFKTAMGIAEGADAQDEAEANDNEQEEQGEKMPWGGNIGFMNERVSQMQGFGSQTPNSLVGTNNPMQGKVNPQFQSPKTSFLPFAISGAASMIGDIAGLANMNKNMPKNVNLPRMNPTNISLQAQREGLQRGYSNASNTMLRNARDVSSPGNAYANQIAGISQLTNSLGDQMGQSWMNEANQNAQFQSRANEMNAQTGSREAMMNAELQGQRASMQGKYIDSMANTIPQMFRDFRAQSMDQNMVNNMGKDYGQYEQINPNERPIDRFRRMMFGSQTKTLNRDNPYII